MTKILRVLENKNFGVYVTAALLGGCTATLATHLEWIGALILLISMAGLLILFIKPVAGLFFLTFSTISSLEVPVTKLGPKLVTLNFDLPILATLLVILLFSSIYINNRLALKIKAGSFERLLFWFLIVAFLSLLVSLFYLPVQDVLVGFLYLVQWILYLSIPLLVLNYIGSNPKVLKWLLVILLVSGVVTSSYFGFLYLSGNVPKLARGNIGYRGKVIPRLKGFWAQGSNVTGMYLALHASIALGLFLTSRSRKARLFLGGFVFLCAVLTLFTYSRSAYLALLFGLGLPLFLRKRKLLYGLLVVTLILSPFILPNTVIHRITQGTFYYREVPALGMKIPFGGAAQRINAWVKLLPLIGKHPFIGSGFNLTAANTSRIYGEGFIADNTYLSLLVNVGFIGLFLFLLMAKTVFIRTSQVFKRVNDWVFKGLALGVVGGLSAFLVWAFWSDVYARWRVLSPLFMYIGLVMSVPLHGRKIQEDA